MKHIWLNLSLDKEIQSKFNIAKASCTTYQVLFGWLWGKQLDCTGVTISEVQYLDYMHMYSVTCLNRHLNNPDLSPYWSYDIRGNFQIFLVSWTTMMLLECCLQSGKLSSEWKVVFRVFAKSIWLKQEKTITTFKLLHPTPHLNTLYNRWMVDS